MRIDQRKSNVVEGNRPLYRNSLIQFTGFDAARVRQFTRTLMDAEKNQLTDAPTSSMHPRHRGFISARKDFKAATLAYQFSLITSCRRNYRQIPREQRGVVFVQNFWGLRPIKVARVTLMGPV